MEWSEKVWHRRVAKTAGKLLVAEDLHGFDARGAGGRD